jgi:D-amino-acid oxidase
MSRRVTVVGAGVVGLSCAVRLAESGAEVNVLARDLPLETSSAVAGGLWLPDLDESSQDVARWSRATLVELARLADDEEEPRGGRSGVQVMPGTLLHRPGPAPDPAWAGDVEDLVAVSRVHDPAPGYALGHRLSVPVVHLPRYLQYLVRRLMAADGTLTRLPLATLPERGVVVNCTGVAARAMAADATVGPVRGQVAVLADPGLREWWYAESPGELLYVVPRGTDVVVGGTSDDGDWDTTPDEATGRRLVEKAADLVPALRGAEVVAHRVGLRPARPTVRLELERRPTDDDPDHVRVHCYGHGGSGVTLAWGCAAEVVGLLRQELDLGSAEDLISARLW